MRQERRYRRYPWLKGVCSGFERLVVEKIKVGEATGEVKVKGASGPRLIHTAGCSAHSASVSVCQGHSLLSARAVAISVFQEHSLLSVPSLSEPCEVFMSPGPLWRPLGRQNPYLYTQKQI